MGKEASLKRIQKITIVLVDEQKGHMVRRKKDNGGGLSTAKSGEGGKESGLKKSPRNAVIKKRHWIETRSGGKSIIFCCGYWLTLHTLPIPKTAKRGFGGTKCQR